jgi:hypothetical protein
MTEKYLFLYSAFRTSARVLKKYIYESAFKQETHINYAKVKLSLCITN